MNIIIRMGYPVDSEDEGIMLHGLEKKNTCYMGQRRKTNYHVTWVSEHKQKYHVTKASEDKQKFMLHGFQKINKLKYNVTWLSKINKSIMLHGFQKVTKVSYYMGFGRKTKVSCYMYISSMILYDWGQTQTQD